MSWKRRLFDTGGEGAARDFGLLVLRAGLAVTMLTHGWSKLQGFSEGAASFPDPIGVGPTLSMALVIFAEFFCAIAVLAGFLTRLAVIPIAFTMVIAFFVIHAADPLQQKELAWVYLVGFAALLLTGPGRLSIDGLIRGR